MFGAPIPNKVWVIFVGLFVMGWFVMWQFVLVTVEIIEASGNDLKEKWAKELDEQQLDREARAKEMRKRWKLAVSVLTDKASALANAGFATGSIIGPIIGGRCYDTRGYRGACDVMMVVTACVCVINFIVVFVPDFFKEKKVQVEEQEEDEDEVKIKELRSSRVLLVS